MKNKKVIIITRDSNKTEYENSEAFKNYTAYIANSGKQKIHSYIKKFIKGVLKGVLAGNEDYALKYWNPLTRTGILPSYYEMYGGYDGEQSKYEDLYGQTDKTQEFEEWLKCEITQKIENINPKDTHVGGEVDNKPYVSFIYRNDNKETYDVYFVFLNRIFDIFVNGSEEYNNLINDEKRLDFITAICQDCGLVDDEGTLIEGQQKAMLYIHDKEWYKSDESFSVLLNGEEVPDQKIYANNLKNYFSTIKVFQHTPNHIFNEIKELNFCEEDCEVKLMKRGFF